MKGLLQLVVIAAMMCSFSGNANKKHCVTKKNEHGVMVTTCEGKVMPKQHIEKKKTCVKKIGSDGKKITTCTGKTVKKAH